MKNLDDTLRAKRALKPGRPLSANFTHNVINHVAAKPAHSGWFARIKEKFYMRTFNKPAIAIAAVAVLTVVSGTAYAAVVGWPGVTALFSGQDKLSSGESIVRVETTNCSFITALNVTQERKTDQTYYYKISEDSKLTNEQVTEMVQGHCELEAQAAFATKVQAELQKNPANTGKLVGGYVDSVITAIDDKTVTLESHWPIGTAGSMEVKKITKTFPIDPAAVAYDYERHIAISSLKPGDHVGTVYRATGAALENSEGISPADVDSSKQYIVHFIKNAPSISAALDYRKYNGGEFEEVVPCQKTPIGYCTAAEFHQQ